MQFVATPLMDSTYKDTQETFTSEEQACAAVVSSARMTLPSINLIPLGGRKSRIEYVVDLPSTATKLVIPYHFISQCYPYYVNSYYNDQMTITLNDGQTNTILLYESVNNNADAEDQLATGSPYGYWRDLYENIANEDQSSDKGWGESKDGSYTNYNTEPYTKSFFGQVGRRELSSDISGWAGKRVTIVIEVSDTGDSIYDTAAVIEKIEIK